jgi:hypothetical protein
MDLFFTLNIHAQGLHILYLIKKAPSPETDTIHQFASRVDQFHFFWHVDLSQWFYGTNLFFQ